MSARLLSAISRRVARGLQGQSGLAVPMALVVLVVLAGLMISFTMLSQSEPVIANNQNRGVVTRALAESGVERAIWALTVGSGVTGGVDAPGNGVAAGPPYNGATYIALGNGGFTVKITGANATGTEVTVEAVGWMPDNSSTNNAHRKITANLMRFPNFGFNAPCALCVKGDLEVKGSSTIDARTDTTCGRKYGTYTAGGTCIGGGNCNGNNGSIWGAVDNNNTKNEATDIVTNAPAANFDAFTFSDQQLAVLKQMAKTSGTYIGPGSPPTGSATWTGTVTFNSSNQLTKDGIVFIDTISGNSPIASNPSDYPNVDFRGNPFNPPGGSGDFHGWIIVMGNVTGFNANGTIQGMLYVINDVTSNNGTAAVNGLVIAQNLNNSNGSQTDTSEGGNASISFNCQNANGGGKVPNGWFLNAGTYKEVSGY